MKVVGKRNRKKKKKIENNYIKDNILYNINNKHKPKLRQMIMKAVAKKRQNRRQTTILTLK